MTRLKDDTKAHQALQWINLLLALIVLSVGLVVILAGPAEAEQFATLHPIEGTVEVSEDGGDFAEGREGQVLSAGDTVRTGAGRAEIEYFDDSLTRLDENTTFLLEELSSDPDVPNSKTIIADQQEGRTFERVVAITDSESRFDVETPTATASVRGTTYVLIHLPDGTTIIWVIPDEDPEVGEVVFILEDGTEFVVLEGQGVVAFPDGSLGEPFDLTEEQLTDAWVLFNQCELDGLDLPVCQEEEPPPLPPDDGQDPDEPEPSPEPPPPSAPTFATSSVGGTVIESDGDGNDDGGGGGNGDTRPPTTTITEAPPQLTRSRDATFRFTANEPVKFFECALDGGSFERCTSGRTYAALGDGTHLFQVKATDKAGNRENTASHQWTIDNAPPDTTITGGPSEDCVDGFCFTDQAEFTFQATEDGSRFECMLEEEQEAERGGGGGGQPHDWQSCSSPKTYSGLNDGSDYTFSVRATDRAGNTDPSPATAEWSVCDGESCAFFREGPGRSEGGEGAETGSSTTAQAPPDAAEDVIGSVQETLEQVQETVNDTVGSVQDIADEVEDTADQVVPLPDAPDLPSVPDCRGLTKVECAELKLP